MNSQYAIGEISTDFGKGITISSGRKDLTQIVCKKRDMIARVITTNPRSVYSKSVGFLHIPLEKDDYTFFRNMTDRVNDVIRHTNPEIPNGRAIFHEYMKAGGCCGEITFQKEAPREVARGEVVINLTTTLDEELENELVNHAIGVGCLEGIATGIATAGVSLQWLQSLIKDYIGEGRVTETVAIASVLTSFAAFLIGSESFYLKSSKKIASAKHLVNRFQHNHEVVKALDRGSEMTTASQIKNALRYEEDAFEKIQKLFTSTGDFAGLVIKYDVMTEDSEDQVLDFFNKIL